ncbi:MAG TPA: hypothetical protein VLM89_16405 [Phycisphaerae bacterium]|nr:hypothetical protein [Phycisphaerae bacterium]
MHRRTMWLGLATFVCLTWVAAATAQQPADQPPDQSFRQATSNSPMYWDVDVIMRPYVSLLTRYYNLNEEQEKYTRALLTQRVKRFLGEHERDTRALFDEYLGYQQNGQLPPAEMAREFSGRARPLLAAMYKEIIDGNMKWRDILDDQQKKKHDGDLKMIDQTFKQFDEKFDRWSKGDVRPTDLPTTVSDRPHAIMKHEDAWQYYVRMFIVNYRLDDGQQSAANSVLDETRKEAAAYRLAHKDEFAELEARYQELTQADPKTDPKELEQVREKREGLDKRRKNLEDAISVGMFDRLKQKLLGIPRSDQREAFEKRKSQLAKVAEEARAELKARTSTQPEASSRPTTRQRGDGAAARNPKPTQRQRRQPNNN